MKWLLFLLAIGLGLLAYRQERRLELADAGLQNAQQQIANLDRQLAHSQSAPVHSYYHQPATAETAPSPSLQRPGQWMWEKRSTPLDATSEAGERSGGGRGRHGPR
jgi:hypothetical protein